MTMPLCGHYSGLGERTTEEMSLPKKTVGLGDGADATFCGRAFKRRLETMGRWWLKDGFRSSLRQATSDDDEAERRRRQALTSDDYHGEGCQQSIRWPQKVISHYKLSQNRIT